MLATWNITPEVAALFAAGNKVKAIRAFQRTDHRLADGSLVKPRSLRDAKQILETHTRFGSEFQVAISDGTYSLRDIAAEQQEREAQELRMLRFRTWAQEDGLQLHAEGSATAEMDGACDACGKTSWGIAHFAPDAMGVPTQVYFECSCCAEKRGAA
jgi:hypothetical protein